jgi:hypothetical protein
LIAIKNTPDLSLEGCREEKFEKKIEPGDRKKKKRL